MTKLLSMTGYGEASLLIGDKEWNCVVQSVNSRNLDARFRMPSALQSTEPVFRKQLQNFISRGKVDITFSISSSEKTTVSTVSNSFFNEVWVRDFCNAGESLFRSLDWQSSAVLQSALLDAAFSQRAAFIEPEMQLDKIADPLTGLLNNALIRHLDSRIVEGNQLVADICSRLTVLSDYIKAVADISVTMPDIFRLRIQGRLDTLVDQNKFSLDPSRIAQEVAHLIDKADISEEIVRFNAHIQQYYAEIDSQDNDRKGKKLEFVVQEMLREINTIGSKANMLEITRIVVDVKNELEKIREQVQNIV